MTRLILTTAMCVAMMAATSEAFVPTFVAPRHALHGAFTPRASSSRRASSTALQMNLFDRFSRVAKANLNNILQNLEDPEKIMTQALEDMQVSKENYCVVERPIDSWHPTIFHLDVFAIE